MSQLKPAVEERRPDEARPGETPSVPHLVNPHRNSSFANATRLLSPSDPVSGPPSVDRLRCAGMATLQVSHHTRPSHSQR